MSSGSPLEPDVGFARAARVGRTVAASGTAPGDVRGRTARRLEIVAAALAGAGAPMRDVVRTRIVLTDIGRWRGAAAARGEASGGLRPAGASVRVSGFIHPERLVGVEADAVLP